MRPGGAALILLAGLLAGSVTAPAWAADAAKLSVREQQARRQRHDLQKRIEALQSEMAREQAHLKDAALELRESEQAISDLGRELGALRGQADAVRTELDGLARRQSAGQQLLDERRDALARQLRAQYTSGLSPWTALFSGDNPQDIGRDFAYLAYVSAARTRALAEVTEALDALDALRAGTRQRQAALDALLVQAGERQQALEGQKAAHAAQVARIEARLRAQRKEAGRLEADEARLARLVDALQAEMAREAREAEAARRAAQAARAARDAAPAGAMNGLSQRLPHPADGQWLGRFGAERPEGGVWRGLVVRAVQGSPVRAVASGRVVFASWLSGFGNILILDHGQAYLSVYAYNQSLLKEPGDAVAAGETIATVGATGGQVEPGLYFEIRHQGKPVNPWLWLRP